MSNHQENKLMGVIAAIICSMGLIHLFVVYPQVRKINERISLIQEDVNSKFDAINKEIKKLNDNS